MSSAGTGISRAEICNGEIRISCVGLDPLFHWLQSTAIATAIRENELLFPWIETVHVIAIVLVVGSISIVDLRLLGWASRDRPAHQLMREILPLTWGAFAVAAIAGTLLFSSKAVLYAHNVFFQGKMILMALAGINMLTFHALGGRDVARWGNSAKTPLPARIAASMSLLLWIAIVAFGRWIGFTLD
jgi:hypothetical protein